MLSTISFSLLYCALSAHAFSLSRIRHPFHPANIVGGAYTIHTDQPPREPVARLIPHVAAGAETPQRHRRDCRGRVHANHGRGRRNQRLVNLRPQSQWASKEENIIGRNSECSALRFSCSCFVYAVDLFVHLLSLHFKFLSDDIFISYYSNSKTHLLASSIRVLIRFMCIFSLLFLSRNR